MLQSCATRRSVRFMLGAFAFIAGFTGAKVLLIQSGLALAMIVFTVGLAALVGAGKQATP